MTRLAYLGPPGTFTEEALLTLSDSEGAELVPLGTVPDVVDAVASWRRRLECLDAAELFLQSGDTNHKKLVEVRGKNR